MERKKKRGRKALSAPTKNKMIAEPEKDKILKQPIRAKGGLAW